MLSATERRLQDGMGNWYGVENRSPWANNMPASRVEVKLIQDPWLQST